MAMQPFTLSDAQKAEVETLAAVLTAEHCDGLLRHRSAHLLQHDAAR